MVRSPGKRKASKIIHKRWVQGICTHRPTFQLSSSKFKILQVQEYFLSSIPLPTSLPIHCINSLFSYITFRHIHNHDAFFRMAPESYTVAVEIEDHHITIQFKSDGEVRNIYVHPDNVVLTSGKRSWSERRGEVYTFYQNKYQARVSIKLLCQAFKEDQAAWKDLSVDEVMASICDKISMDTTLWTKIKRWVNSAVVRLREVGAKLAIGYHTAGAIEWR